MKKYIIFDLDGTLIESMSDTLKLIYNELSKIKWTDMELVKYVFTQTMWKPLKKQLELIYKDKTKSEIDEITNIIYKKLSQKEANFFDGAINTIKNLHKKWYKLYLSTWNSTDFAIKTLKRWWIINYFDIVLWSDKILKWPDHLEIFKQNSWDENFYKNAIYVWDGNSDREFAKLKNITFVHIWNDKKDIYEINSIKYLEKLINKID